MKLKKKRGWRLRGRGKREEYLQDGKDEGKGHKKEKKILVEY